MNKKVVYAGQVILGLILVVFGLNGFLSFIPTGDAPPEVLAFMGALMESGYIWQLAKGFEIVIGLALIVNRFVPLALVMLVPLSLNFILFHIFIAFQGALLALVTVALNGALLYAYKDSYTEVLKAKV